VSVYSYALDQWVSGAAIVRASRDSIDRSRSETLTQDFDSLCKKLWCVYYVIPFGFYVICLCNNVGRLK
jgi:hypothetical protein